MNPITFFIFVFNQSIQTLIIDVIINYQLSIIN